MISFNPKALSFNLNDRINENNFNKNKIPEPRLDRLTTSNPQGNQLIFADENTENIFRCSMTIGKTNCIAPFPLARGVQLTQKAVEKILLEMNTGNFIMQQYRGDTYVSASQKIAESYATQGKSLSSVVFIIPQYSVSVVIPYNESSVRLHSFILSSSEDLSNMPISKYWKTDRSIYYFQLSEKVQTTH
jgi:hypothetical protein